MIVAYYRSDDGYLRAGYNRPAFLFGKALALWLSCHTQGEVADAVGVPQRTVTDWIDDFSEKLAADNSLNSPNFDPPIYRRMGSD